MDKWIYQREGYGIGNFVMMTPMIQALSPVGVYFYDEHIKDLYKDWDQIIVLDEIPKSPPMNSGGLPKRTGKESDYEAWHRILAVDTTMFDPYVPKIESTIRLSSDSIALLHGCGSKRFKESKDIGDIKRQYWIEATLKSKCTPVILGNMSDYDNYWCDNNLKECIDYLGKLSLKETVGLLQQCRSFFSNDTGLYHVASASRLFGTIYWKETNFEKNVVPSERVANVFI